MQIQIVRRPVRPPYKFQLRTRPSSTALTFQKAINPRHNGILITCKCLIDSFVIRVCVPIHIFVFRVIISFIVLLQIESFVSVV